MPKSSLIGGTTAGNAFGNDYLASLPAETTATIPTEVLETYIAELEKSAAMTTPQASTETAGPVVPKAKIFIGLVEKRTSVLGPMVEKIAAGLKKRGITNKVDMILEILKMILEDSPEILEIPNIESIFPQSGDSGSEYQQLIDKLEGEEFGLDTSDIASVINSTDVKVDLGQSFMLWVGEGSIYEDLLKSGIAAANALSELSSVSTRLALIHSALTKLCTDGNELQQALIALRDVRATFHVVTGSVPPSSNFGVYSFEDFRGHKGAEASYGKVCFLRFAVKEMCRRNAKIWKIPELIKFYNLDKLLEKDGYKVLAAEFRSLKGKIMTLKGTQTALEAKARENLQTGIATVVRKRAITISELEEAYSVQNSVMTEIENMIMRRLQLVYGGQKVLTDGPPENRINNFYDFLSSFRTVLENMITAIINADKEADKAAAKELAEKVSLRGRAERNVRKAQQKREEAKNSLERARLRLSEVEREEAEAVVAALDTELIAQKEAEKVLAQTTVREQEAEKVLADQEEEDALAEQERVERSVEEDLRHGTRYIAPPRWYAHCLTIRSATKGMINASRQRHEERLRRSLLCRDNCI